MIWRSLTLIAARPRHDDTSPREIIQGILVLAVFLVVCYVIGKTVARVKNRWFAGVWSPLVPLLDGAQVMGDGGVATTSRLSGRYRGASVHALMTPNVQRNHYAQHDNGNQFDVVIENVPGAEDWSIVWELGLPLVRDASWVVRPSGSPLGDRLVSAGVIAHVEPFGRASTHYRARDQVIEWSGFIEPRVILSPEQFRQLLDALVALEVVNRRVNRV